MADSPTVYVRTIYGKGYEVDADSIVVHNGVGAADLLDPSFPAGVALSHNGGNVFIPMTNIDRIVWKDST